MAIKKTKRLKLAVSILGATLIFGTFLVKDAKRDKLKELVDSIDAAETAFMIRMDDRKNLTEFRKFETEFEEFRQHPTTPLGRLGDRRNS